MLSLYLNGGTIWDFLLKITWEQTLPEKVSNDISRLYMSSVLAAMTMQLHMHKISSKPSFILPRPTKLLRFYAHSRKPVRSLVSLKMSISALGSCVKL